jgi:hypothetical protein
METVKELLKRSIEFREKCKESVDKIDVLLSDKLLGQIKGIKDDYKRLKYLEEFDFENIWKVNNDGIHKTLTQGTRAKELGKVNKTYLRIFQCRFFMSKAELLKQKAMEP